MARTKPTKQTAQDNTTEDLRELVERNQDQLQDLAGQLNALELKIEDLMDNLETSREVLTDETKDDEDLSSSEECGHNRHKRPDLQLAHLQIGQHDDVMRFTRENGTYILKFRSINLFRWIGVLTVGAVIGIFIMGIFG